MPEPLTPERIIDLLGMTPHPEGGHYVETYRDAPPGGGRGVKTGIFFLLRAGERSHWHRVDAVEMWHWHAGGALELSISEDGRSVDRLILGMDLAAGQRPQGVVPAHTWQAARPLDGPTGGWVLVGCTVSPAFEFAGFEMAPEGWEPG
ncbi:cupin domain-containing protein [Azospirillum rugosum]|uniref:Cupin superfamily sugar epimerase n=1 Tax=Azospirillum rugosum TaxID=416170 RepID=A0ABS4SGY2_9PROT|nr:cupin domain-containing protein [Azospirillum rugosum]MBP2291710.1 putative cupin superfamily sugar epimerase [Azospirillum rugosum]MDQ0524478.1 putative cupin superfamily sugar epimerase [Azospirillum rugosum]